MKKLISKLHEKPEHHRKAVTFGVSLVITLAILGIWVSTLPYRFSDKDIAADAEKIKNELTPVATAKESISEALKALSVFQNNSN